MKMLREYLKEFTPLVAGAIIYSVEAMLTGDEALARRIGTDNSRLNDLYLEIEKLVYGHIRKGDLNDRDLRFGVSVVLVTQALVQIGDHAANAAHLGLRAMQKGVSKLPPETAQELTDMSYSAADMVNDAVRAFIDTDTRLAEATVRRDRELNEAFEHLSGILTPLYATPEQHRLMLWIVNNLQEIGVCATNICARAIFVATGEIKEFH